MNLTHQQLREKYKKFWQERGHKEVPPAPLSLSGGDSTTLFTSSGMQQLVPYLLGEAHPLGKQLFDIQPCFRSQDIDEIGDNRHTTFFEMLGNWSLGTYFKKEQLPWFFSFLTNKEIGIGLDPNRLYVTVFKGNDQVPKDTESIEIWKEIFAAAGVNLLQEKRIYEYDASKNWWSRAGQPYEMPAGEPGGPDSEVFYRFDVEHDPKYGPECHPNCDCGRFMEIGNSVFMQYKKVDEKNLEELPQKNVDFGGGLERLLAASYNNPDIFKTDLFDKIIHTIQDVTGHAYHQHTVPMRIIADHLKVATFLIVEGVRPSNKEQGYFLRRVLRRTAIKLRELHPDYTVKDFSLIAKSVLTTYQGIYFDVAKDEPTVRSVIDEEMERFSKSLEKGLKEIHKYEHIDGKIAFDIYQSYGFPLELIEELAREKGQPIDREQFYAEFKKHKDASRTASAGMFKGGLADHSDQVLKYHTATHLIHQALFDVLGEVRQDGSNITAERLRFDFTAQQKPSAEQIKEVETIVNTKIKEHLPMRFMIMPKAEAEKIGARSFFKEKYPDMVKVYYIGGEDNKPETAYSKEFCGGPHVKNTSEIGSISIYKFEKIGSNIYRLYAK